MDIKEYYTDSNRIFYGNKKQLAKVVEAMNTIVCMMNDERPYFDHWILIVPDEATEEDFEDIAEDKDLLDATIESFKGIVLNYFDEEEE